MVPQDPTKASLLLTKHAEYVEAFEKDKDDYVGWTVALVTLCVSVALKVWHWIGRVLSDNAKVSSSFMQQRRNGVLKNWMLLIPPPPPLL